MSIIELKLLIVALLFTNMWSIFRIMEGYWIPKWIKRRWNAFWGNLWNKCKSKLSFLIEEEPVKSAPLEDFVGKSHFKMPHVIATEREQKLKEILDSGVEVQMDEVSFEAEDEHPKAQESKRTFAQVADQELDKAFSDNRVYGDSENGRAEGCTFEDIDTAVITVKKRNPAPKEVDHAGKVFYEIEDNELFFKLTESPEMFEKIRNVIDRHLDKMAKESKDMHYQDNAWFKDPFGRVTVPDNIEDFDIRNYV